MKEFKDRIAVVTGAASGIGLGMAERFLEAGMKVVLADVDEEKLAGAVRLLKDAGAPVLGVPTDVSQPEQVEALRNETLDAFGAVHVLCNNAGVGYPGGRSWELPLTVWNWVLGVNLMGVIHGHQVFMPVMLDQNNEGHVVNTASIAGLVANPIGVPYGVSKHAVVALSESLHTELQNLGAKVGVSVLCPGASNTDIMNSSERNLPDSIPRRPDLTDHQTRLRKAYDIWIERGLEPREIGRQVLEAVREERFWVITHDYDSYIKGRLQNILDRKNPEPFDVSQEVSAILQEMMNES